MITILALRVHSGDNLEPMPLGKFIKQAQKEIEAGVWIVMCSNRGQAYFALAGFVLLCKLFDARQDLPCVLSLELAAFFELFINALDILQLLQRS